MRTKCVVPVALRNCRRQGGASRPSRCSPAAGNTPARTPRRSPIATPCATSVDVVRRHVERRTDLRRTPRRRRRRDTAVWTMSPAPSSLAAAPELLDAAVNESVDTFARHCRELSRHLVASRPTSDAEELDRQRAQSNVKRWVDKVTGMCHTHVELDPIRDAAISSTIDAELARLRQRTATPAPRGANSRSMPSLRQ